MADEDKDREIVRTVLDEVAGMPVGGLPSPVEVTRRVRRRRRVRAVGIGGASLAVVVVALTVFTAVSSTQGSDRGRNTERPEEPAIGRNDSGLNSIACGQPFTVKYVAEGPAKLRIEASGVHRVAGVAAMPDVDVRVSADQAVQVSGSPAKLDIEIAIVHNGVTVDRIGGSDRPENATSTPGQGSGTAAIAKIWPLTPSAPLRERISRSRWTACPGVDWSAINAAPERYQVITLLPAPLVFGPTGPLAGSSDSVIGTAVALGAVPMS